MFSAIIIDDEQDSISTLSQSLKKVFGDAVKIVATTSTVNEAAVLIKEYQPDLIFLDILLSSNDSGFDLLPLIEKLDYPFKIVFTTGYHQFAIKAIRTGAYDYLLKPIGSEDLLALKNRLEADKSKNKETNTTGVIIVNNSDATYKIQLDTISHFKGEGNYTAIYFTQKDKPILSSVSLNQFESELSGNSDIFFRTHKSFLVNLSEIDFIKKHKMSRSLVMKNGEFVSISRLKYKAFLERYL